MHAVPHSYRTLFAHSTALTFGTLYRTHLWHILPHSPLTRSTALTFGILYRSHLWHTLPLSSFALSTSLTFCALFRTHLLHSLPLSIFALSTVLTFCTLYRCSAAVIMVLTHLSLQPIKANITTTVTTTIVKHLSQLLTPVAHQKPSS